MFSLLLFIAFAFAQEAPASPSPTAPEVLAVPVEDAPTLSTYAPTVVFPIRAANLEAVEVRAAEVLFRRRYEEATKQATADESRVRAAIGASDDRGLHAACVALACTRWITIDLVRLDKEIFVTAIERDGAAVVTQRVEVVASGLDALPDTFTRVARALADRVPIERIPAAPSAPPVATSGAPSPTPPPPPRTTESLPGFKFGVHGPLFPGFGLSLSHAFNWRWEKKDKFYEMSAGFTAPLGISGAETFGMIFAEFGLSHVFTSKGSTALYAGGGLGPRIGGYADLGFGVGLHGQAGVMFGRQSSNRAYLQLRLGGDAFTGWVRPYVVSYAGVETGVSF